MGLMVVPLWHQDAGLIPAWHNGLKDPVAAWIWSLAWELHMPWGGQKQTNKQKTEKQNTNGIFHRTRTNDFQICVETLQTLNNQNNLKKKEQSWRSHAPWLQTKLQSYSNQNSMVLAQKQTHRSKEQNKEPRNKSTHLWPINLQQRRQEYIMEKRQSLQ